MNSAYLYTATRTPFGRFNGALARTRPDDLASATISALLDRTPQLDPNEVADVILGNANGAGEWNGLVELRR